MQRTGLNAPRSRAGCQECRRRRKKCSQTKPKCLLCERAGTECNYETKLSWGGRPFAKSIFGKSLQCSGQLDAVKDEDGAFVYALVGKDCGESAKQKSPKKETAGQQVKAPPDLNELRRYQDIEDVEIQKGDDSHALVQYKPLSTQATSLTQVPFELSPNPDLPYLKFLKTPYQSLLNHFVTVTAPSLSCHTSVCQDYTSTLIPMAFSKPGLMAAILHMAGQNRRTLALTQSGSDLDTLKAFSVSSLRELLANPSPDSQDLALATILALCSGDIVADGARPGSWRTHLRGAAALLESNTGHTGPGLQRDKMSDLQMFLRRWYLSIEGSTLLGSNHSGLHSSYPTALRLSYELGPSIIDEVCGFPPYLIRIFGEFTALAAIARSTRDTIMQAVAGGYEAPDSVHETQSQCLKCGYALLDDLDRMYRGGTLCPDTERSLTPAMRLDFLALNTAFHHSAAVHIHRRVLQTPTVSPLVQTRVKAIVQLVSTVTFLRDACPAVAFLLPLFSAGCEALDEETRKSITDVLGRMRTIYGIGNVRSALGLLEEVWRRREIGEDVEWETLSDELGLDLLCY